MRSGVLSGVTAYVLWGMFPLYWGLLEPASPTEVLAARVVFSLASLALLVTVVRQWGIVGDVWRSPRPRALLAVAAVLVSVNWGVFIWAVANDHVIDTALGYFINPLVSVILGVAVLRERLRGLQWLAVGIATVGVLYATLSLGRLPWIALVLALSFGLYGLVKKLAGIDAIPSLTVETTVMAPVALGYLAWLAGHGELALGAHGPGHAALMVLAGPVTALPLLFFGYAATRIPLSVLGPLQYVAPSLQLAIGVLVLGESMTTGRWVSFLIVWVALVIFTVDAVAAARRGRARSVAPALVGAAQPPTH